MIYELDVSCDKKNAISYFRAHFFMKIFSRFGFED